ncbi:MAG: prolyl oligopeptidase family serine peptidase [Alphaproteobacteria bacterium]|nr:prolyl oligopeptidase family serine peptidase [Alphaproteobacteria bacterium]
MGELQSGRRGAAQGMAKHLVILVHGYGADGNDLLGLADPLGEHLPDTVFVAPNAPNKCSGNPFGFEWFPIPWLDGSSEEAARTGMAAAVDDLNAFIDKTMADEGVTAAQTILLGFSQGTMMSLHIAPRRAVPVAGIVGFSGRLLEPETLADAVVSRPPVLLIHGDQDDMVPIASLPEAADALSAAGFEVYTHISKGMAHGIAPDGLGVALQFMREKLGIKA